MPEQYSLSVRHYSWHEYLPGSLPVAGKCAAGSSCSLVPNLTTSTETPPRLPVHVLGEGEEEVLYYSLFFTLNNARNRGVLTI